MGKKILSQVQVKISKTEKKQQLNSLIKMLRPKVYITDSSSFKTLVQDLTGNGSCSSRGDSSQLLLPSSPSPSSSSSLPQIVEKVVPVIDVEDDHGNPENSMDDSSLDASVESFQVCCNHSALSAEEINQGYVPLLFDDTNSSEYIFMDHQEDPLAYGDLQALLFDNIDEQYPSFNVYSQIQQEISVYDYELSGLI
ncbi:hypothetical protein DITRI_Ditri11bG0033000 [Diplodiscus trichospermus]